jgi:pimeloyl-ACP methyl ester carboxylesterase
LATSAAAWNYFAAETDGFALARRACGVGKALVFLHGFGTTSASWLRCAESITGAYHKILLDLPGHGRSGRTLPDVGALDYCVEMLAACLRQPDLRNCVVAAHSFGGYLLLRAIIDQHINLSGLILVDVPAFPQRPPDVVNFFAGGLSSSFVLAVTPLEFLTWVGQREVFHAADKIPSQLIQEYASDLRVPGTASCLQQLAKAIRLELEAPSPLGLERLSTPTLILWGSHDRLVPLDSGRKLHDALPVSELHILPSTGHAPQEESPQQTATLIQKFLEQIY